jgi:hypothetical protein
VQSATDCPPRRGGKGRRLHPARPDARAAARLGAAVRPRDAPGLGASDRAAGDHWRRVVGRQADAVAPVPRNRQAQVSGTDSRALAYYKRSLLPPVENPSEMSCRQCPGDTPCVARFYELRSNRPLYITKGTRVQVLDGPTTLVGGYEVSYSDESVIHH